MQNRFPVRLARILGGLQATAAPDPSEGSPVGGSQLSEAPISPEVPAGDPPPTSGVGSPEDEADFEDETDVEDEEKEAEHDCNEDDEDD